LLPHIHPSESQHVDFIIGRKLAAARGAIQVSWIFTTARVEAFFSNLKGMLDCRLREIAAAANFHSANSIQSYRVVHLDPVPFMTMPRETH
jgi:hypothetical protein